MFLCGGDYKIYSHNGDHIYLVYYNEKAGGICVSCPSATDWIAAVFLNCLYNLGAQGAAAYSSCPRVKGGIYLSTSRVRQTTTHSHIHTYCRMATDMHANQTSMSLYCGWEPERVQTVAGRTCRLYTERSPMDADVDISSIKLEY